MEGTILVADDDRSIRTVLAQALTRAGCRVRATGTASTLWRWIEEGEGDVVVTDVMMPDGDALDLLPAIRKRRPTLPVIVMSAQNTVMTAIRAAHMYEEPAVDVYPLLDVAMRSDAGVGRIGTAGAGMSVRQLARLAQNGLASKAVQIALAAGVSPDDLAERVAIACGAGDDLLDDALSAGAKVLVSGELRYHSICRAAQAGLSTILVGHHASERMSMEKMADAIQAAAGELRVWVARSEREPLVNLDKLG